MQPTETMKASGAPERPALPDQISEVAEAVPKSKHEQEQQANAAEARVMLQKGFDDDEAELLGACLKISRKDRGSSTPGEHFLLSLLLYYAWHGSSSMNPDSIEREFDEFRDNFEDAVTVARDMLRDFPEYLNITADEEAEVAA